MRKFFLLLVMWAVTAPQVMAQNDLPSPSANFQQVKNGSLVIPMDTLNQKRPGFFNLKAYGLVNELLQNEIPIRWAIRSGKTRTAGGSIDFTVNAMRVFPDTVATVSTSFRSGPFIIDSAWVDKALPIIAAFGNNVQVFKVMANINVDIRYTLTHKPRILLLNSTGYDTIAVKVLQEAAINASSYKLNMPAGAGFHSNGSWSLISETHLHTTDTALLNPLLRYANDRGANLMMSCATLGAMENATFTMTTTGVDSFSTGLAATAYLNPDLPIAQFQGTILSPNGEYKLWKPKPGGSMKPHTYEFMRGSSGALLYTMAGKKLRSNSLPGGNLFYISGHDHYHWTAPTGSINDMNRINGRRIFLNAIFIPASDSIEGIDFKTDVAISMVAQPGFAVKYEPFKIYIIASNNGPGTARTLNVEAALPTGLLYSSHTSTYGTFNPVSGIWSMDSLQKNQTDTLVITTIINQLGNISYTTVINNPSLEYNKINNTATLNLFGVSRPDAVNDTLQFMAALYYDYPVKNNDSDEDTGPFANSQIIAGPFHGTAFILNGDSIRYTLAAGFTGIDSLRYVTCDNYPLCDTAWFFIVVSSPLPVNLIGFTGYRADNEIQLFWNTLSEKNNDRFDIERSFDGKIFERRGTVSGNGTTNIPSSYKFKDIDHEASILYYRLSQYDIDGTRTVSNSIALPKKSGKGFSATVYPNPGDGTLQVIKAEGVKGDLNFTLYDLSGRMIFTETWTPDENGFITDLFNVNHSLAAGTYMATFHTDTETRSIKLVVR